MPGSELHCGLYDIGGLGSAALSSLQAKASLEAWAELDDLLFACGSTGLSDLLPSTDRRVKRLWRGVDPRNLFAVRGVHPGAISWPESGLEVLARGGPFAIVRATSDAFRKALAAGVLPAHGEDSHAGHAAGCGGAQAHVRPFAGQMVLARQSANRAPHKMITFGPAAVQAVEAVDRDRWLGHVETLAGWDRFTHGGEIDMARDWLVSQFTAIAGLNVSTQAFSVGASTVDNVIAELPGSSRPEDWILVGAHYDAISEDPLNAAPGAEDNASGCAGVLELAHILSALPPEATVFFICYSGEEQGLFGSKDHAGRLVSQGDDAKVGLMLNMDMIGFSGDSDLDVLIETNPPFASALDPFADAAAAFTPLRVVTSLFAFGSDHVPYLDRDIPAVLTIENDWDSYPDYHRTGDLPENIVRDMGYQVLRMNAAVLAHLAGATADTPLFADGFESGDTDAWSPPSEY